jgi:hypothetical protein
LVTEYEFYQQTGDKPDKKCPEQLTDHEKLNVFKQVG